MRSSKGASGFVLQLTLLAAAAVLLAGCGQDSATSEASLRANPPKNGTSLPLMSGANVLRISVNGSTCASNSYPNKPCVSVTLCAPDDGSNCQTISDLLLDTGSSGLRVFKSVLNPQLASALRPMTSGTAQVAECQQYGDGSSTWGPVALASVGLGGEQQVKVPIQLVDSSYFTVPGSCGHPQTSPTAANAGFNGILGVGLFRSDCGSGCATAAGNQVYYACEGAQCQGLALSEDKQVPNPVALLPKDNNGVVVRLPSVPYGGATSAEGYLVLGIGTEKNNSPAGVVTFPASSDFGEFTTAYNGKNYPSFLDSGSNAYFIPATAPTTLPNCSEHPTWYCPASTLALSATVTGSSSGAAQSGTSSAPSREAEPFQIGNFITLLNSGYSVFAELGADSGHLSGDSLFDWGLPFYLGRDIYVGFEGQASKLGIGPYWAY